MYRERGEVSSIIHPVTLKGSEKKFNQSTNQDISPLGWLACTVGIDIQEMVQGKNYICSITLSHIHAQVCLNSIVSVK